MAGPLYQKWTKSAMLLVLLRYFWSQSWHELQSLSIPASVVYILRCEGFIYGVDICNLCWTSCNFVFPWLYDNVHDSLCLVADLHQVRLQSVQVKSKKASRISAFKSRYLLSWICISPGKTVEWHGSITLENISAEHALLWSIFFLQVAASG